MRRENRAPGTSCGGDGSCSMGPTRRWQAITDASVFYLLSSTHPASLASTSLFGLAYWPTYHYYHGHVMWDIETFTVPPLLLPAPDAAHALLDYRFRHLERRTAQRRPAGWRGAMYPWESCPQHGEESTPGARPYTEDHVSWTSPWPSLATSTRPATGTTRDGSRGPSSAPSPSSSCHGSSERAGATRSWARSARARSTQPVDNNAYTNMAAALALEAAVRLRPIDRRAAPALWSEIADGLVIPRDRRRGAIINHDGARLIRAAGRRPRGRRRPVSARLSTDPDAELATYRYAAQEQAPALCRRADAQRPAACLRGPSRRAGPRRAVCSRRGYGDVHQRALPGAGRVPSVPTGPAPSVSDVRQSQRVPDRTPVRFHRPPAKSRRTSDLGGSHGRLAAKGGARSRSNACGSADVPTPSMLVPAL